ncbi:hypothetical protein BV22DRAFT_319529 [Leucogyrophana mollusca]|uniref:Uncharacterized protein n=1 Tax=Leucogyrophana mollusca TaxID=85980 RepID=A0ACB8BLW8_9AGAM|nr:hypothetical protein BV22DRAFT_319529 [Leucogyrophana mollusca]
MPMGGRSRCCIRKADEVLQGGWHIPMHPRSIGYLLHQQGEQRGVRRGDPLYIQVHNTWFTRGWTLIAPHRIKSYGKGWRPLGVGLAYDSKASVLDERIMSAVSRVTKISAEELTVFEAGTDMIDVKMTWAAKRQTTRQGGCAYAVLDIPDVSMAVAYERGTRRGVGW